MKKIEHKPKPCMIVGCKTEASKWIELERCEDSTFYLCLDHAAEMSNEDGMIPLFEPIVMGQYLPPVIRYATVRMLEVAEYACSENCNVCNQ